MATAALVILCLLVLSDKAIQHTLAADPARVAYVRWNSHLSDAKVEVTSVTISNSTTTLRVPGDRFKNVSLPPENGPDSYWTVNVTCVDESMKMDGYLFLDSNATTDMYYTLCIYGNCTNDVTPNLFVQALNQITPSVPRLGIDQAMLEVHNNLSFPVIISQLSDNCYECKPYSLGQIIPGQQWSIILDTTFAWTIYINSSVSVNDSAVPCTQHQKYIEHSRFALTLLVDGNCTMEHSNMVSGYVVYLPILYAVVAILCVAVVWGVGKVAWWYVKDRGFLHYLHLTRVDRVTARDLGNPRKVNSKYGAVSPQEAEPLNQETNSSLNNNSILGAAADQSSQSSAAESPKTPSKKRLASLDSFRGFALVIMIFVNYGGGGYWFFNHSRWNGLTVADLVFPWFVWIMGVSIVFSYKGRRKDSLWSRIYQVFRRTVILFALGLFLNNGFNISHWRIPGVLQRFAITYFVVALTELFTSELYHTGKHWFTPTNKCLRAFRDITANAVQWAMILALEVLWLAITFLLPVSGCPKGYLGPGGLLMAHRNLTNCTGGAAGKIDRWLLGESHIYQHATAKELYHLVEPYDPEGILGSLNSIVICFLGVQAGRILTSYKTHYNILFRFLIWGIFLGGIGVVLCEGQKNEGIIPLNKNLWSLSFILVMAGSGYILLAVFYLIIDVISWWNGAPFKYPGMNSILVYAGSEILQQYFPFSWRHQNDSHLNLLFANLLAVSLWIAIAYYWFWIKFFVKI